MNISLIIATYNRGSAIGPTLTSAFLQTRSVGEVIVVDDGSTDDTANWVRQNFPAVRVITKRNGGTSSARNAGARAARGDWLMFLDHDDWLLPNAVEVLINLARHFPTAAALHADHVYDNVVSGVRHENHHHTLPAFRRLLNTACLERSPRSRLHGYPLYLSLLQGNLLQQPYAIRRAIFAALGGYSEDVRYCEDWDLYLRVAQQHRVAVTDDVISRHLIEGENLHLTAAQKQEVMYERVLRRRWLSHSRFAFRENRIVRQKLASLAKTEADRAQASGNVQTAWSQCVRSASWWPWDYVVVARSLLWLPRALLAARTAAGKAVKASVK